MTALLWLSPPGAHAQPRTLTVSLSSVGGEAVVRNPALAAERAKRRIAGAQLIQAGLLPNPQLSTSLDAPAFGPPPGTQLAVGASLSWEPTALIVRGATQRAARRAMEQVDLEVAWQEWLVAVEARRQFRASVWLSKAVEQSRKLETGLRQRASALKAAAGAKDATVLELSAAVAAANQATVDRVVLERDRAVATQRLRQLLGVVGPAEVLLDGALLDAAQSGAVPASLQQDVEARRTDLLALERAAASQDAQQSAARLSRLPKVSIGPSFARDTGGVQTVGGALTLELPVLNRAQGQIEQTGATAVQLREEQRARGFQARSDVERLTLQLQVERQMLAAMEESLPGLEELARVYDAGLKEGLVDALNAFSALKDLYRRKLEVLAQRRAIGEVVSDLELASGTLFGEGSAP